MSERKTPVVELLTYADVKKAALTLYQAFDDDDVARYCTRHLEDQPEKKRQVDLLQFEAYVQMHILRGLALVIKGEGHESRDTFETVALWEIPNGGSTDDYLTFIRTGFAKLAWYTGSEGRRRVFNVMFPVLHGNFHDITECDPNHDNYYTLVYLGSTPAARGKGNVRAMFEHMFRNYADPANACCYLESSSKRNFPIYEKFGFRAVADIWLGDKEDPVDKARMDVMIRGPQGAEWAYLDATRERRGYVVPQESVAK